jgi:hypothetical protein
MPLYPLQVQTLVTSASTEVEVRRVGRVQRATPYQPAGPTPTIYSLITHFTSHCATNRKVAGSIPYGVGFFH